MTTNRDVFDRDPTTMDIPNLGVAKVGRPRTPEEWEVLRWELENFVCDGEYQRGLDVILSQYLGRLNRPQQPAVWVSGFYGSGKSHFVRVLDALWTDLSLPGGATARGLPNLPNEIKDHLTELTTAGRQAGGLWSAAGTLGSTASGDVRLALLQIFFQAAELPTQIATARFVLWLTQNGYLDGVKAGIEGRGKNFISELSSMYVSPPLAESLIDVVPGFAANVADAHALLRQQFPLSNSINNDEFLQIVEDILSLHSTVAGKLPCTLIVVDELQQFLGGDLERILELQTIVEDCSSKFGSKLLFVATGQAALGSTPELQRLQDRFQGRVTLSDSDVETVVRQVVLRKTPGKMSELQGVLDQVSGEVDRHLGGTRIEARPSDKTDLIPDYPLLPTRRRFWETAIRAIDSAGKSGQLRTQLRIVQEANKSVAGRPLGWVVGADAMYDQLKDDMQQTGVLSRDIATRIDEENDGSDDGILRSRICALAFLIGALPTEGPIATGLKTTPDILADLLVEDLNVGSASLRQRIPVLLTALVDSGALMEVGGEYRLQTRESADWEQDFRGRLRSLVNNDQRIADERGSELRNAVDAATKNMNLTQGVSNTARKITLHFGQDAPSADTGDVPVWVRDEWSTTEANVRADAQQAGTDSPVVFVILPRREADAIRDSLAGAAAAAETISLRPPSNTPEGIEAKLGMESKQRGERAKLDAAIERVIGGARVFQGGGNEVVQSSLREAVNTAAKDALARLFPRFDVADHDKWGNALRRAREGAADSLSQVDYQGDVDKHPVCLEVRNFVGPGGKKGSEVRGHFSRPNFGWPQDAIDGALLTLVVGGFLRARLNTQDVTVKEITQGQVGVVEFQSEGSVIQTGHRFGIRQLAKDIGLTVNPGEESQAIRPVLERLLSVASKAGGEPPIQAQPDVDHINKLSAMAGNEQLIAVSEARSQLTTDYKDWATSGDKIADRLPTWNRLKSLIRHAELLPDSTDIFAQVAAINSDRSLLSDPDPTTPLANKLVEELRKELSDVRSQLVDAQESELAVLASTTEWNKLPEIDRNTILVANSLTPIPSIDTSDADSLLVSLDTNPLSAWRGKLTALPGQIGKAREDAAKQLEPETVRVHPQSATLRNHGEVDDYLTTLRGEIIQHIDAGKPVIL